MKTIERSAFLAPTYPEDASIFDDFAEDSAFSAGEQQYPQKAEQDSSNNPEQEQASSYKSINVLINGVFREVQEDGSLREPRTDSMQPDVAEAVSLLEASQEPQTLRYYDESKSSPTEEAYTEVTYTLTPSEDLAKYPGLNLEGFLVVTATSELKTYPIEKEVDDKDDNTTGDNSAEELVDSAIGPEEATETESNLEPEGKPAHQEDLRFTYETSDTVDAEDPTYRAEFEPDELSPETETTEPSEEVAGIFDGLLADSGSSASQDDDELVPAQQAEVDEKPAEAINISDIFDAGGDAEPKEYETVTSADYEQLGTIDKEADEHILDTPRVTSEPAEETLVHNPENSEAFVASLTPPAEQSSTEIPDSKNDIVIDDKADDELEVETKLTESVQIKPLDANPATDEDKAEVDPIKITATELETKEPSFNQASSQIVSNLAPSIDSFAISGEVESEPLAKVEQPAASDIVNEPSPAISELSTHDSIVAEDVSLLNEREEAKQAPVTPSPEYQQTTEEITETPVELADKPQPLESTPQPAPITKTQERKKAVSINETEVATPAHATVEVPLPTVAPEAKTETSLASPQVVRPVEVKKPESTSPETADALSEVKNEIAKTQPSANQAPAMSFNFERPVTEETQNNYSWTPQKVANTPGPNTAKAPSKAESSQNNLFDTYQQTQPVQPSFWTAPSESPHPEDLIFSFTAPAKPARTSRSIYREVARA